MRKTVKKLAAVALAAAMTLGSTVMASAATMNVYIREWTQGTSSNTYLGTPNPNPNGLSSPAFTVTDVNSAGTYKDALELAVAQKKVELTWDESYPEYLTGLKVVGNGYYKTNNGSNQNPIYDTTHFKWGTALEGDD